MPSDALRRAFADALNFVLPVECAGCDEPDIALCDRCRNALEPAVAEQWIDGMRVTSGLAFEGTFARVIRSLKEEGRTGLARDLGPALAAAAHVWSGCVVVPVPTSPAAMRSRGYRVAELVARRAGLQPERLLRVSRQTADQRALGRDARAANVTGSMRARDAAGRSILLVDDVVTTGSTLREAARALRAEGAEVRGAATVAATARRSATA